MEEGEREKVSRKCDYWKEWGGGSNKKDMGSLILVLNKLFLKKMRLFFFRNEVT